MSQKINDISPETILYYGGYPTTSEQFYFLELIFNKYFINPFNCSHKNLLQLQIIYDCLTAFNSCNDFNQIHYLNRVIAEQLYLIAKEVSYLHELLYNAKIEKIFGNYKDHLNSEEAVISDFVNKMSHLVAYREFNKSKIIILLESLIYQIKQDINMQKFSVKYAEEETRRIANKLFSTRNKSN
jgi:hypothetical protein